MGPRGMARRRGRRRGLVVWSGSGSAAARRNERNSNDNSQQQQQYDQPEDSVDELAELEKLGKLKQDGILTEDEFQAKKKQILGI